jgi:tight adherence protein B
VAEREWQLTTNFEQTLAVLRERLADPTADAVCETLSVAYQLGGNDLDKRLASLAEDRSIDLNGRKDARAKQSGVRFARRFVLIVPAGMALVGLSIGNGRAAYQTSGGQIGVLVGLTALAACWAWAGTLMRMPGESRVFTSNGRTP